MPFTPDDIEHLSYVPDTTAALGAGVGATS
jgi:hypothetical protein